MHDYLVHEVGHPVTSRDAQAFLRWSHGDPGLPVDMVASSVESESWKVANGVAVLVERPVPTPQTIDDIDATAGGLAGDVLAVVESFAAAVPVIGGPLADWLPLTPLVEMVGIDALVAAEREGVIEADGDRVRLVVPYLADVVGSRTPALRNAQVTGRLADAFTAGGGPVDDMAALTGLLAMSSFDTPTTPDLRTAARSCLRLGDPAATRRLAAAGLESDPDDADLAAVHAWALLHLNDSSALSDAIRGRGDDQAPAWLGLVDFLAEFAVRGEIGARAFVDRHDRNPGGLVAAVDEWMERDALSGSWFAFALAETAMLLGRFDEARVLLRAAAVGADSDGLLVFHLALVEERLITAVSGADRACVAVERARSRTRWRSDQARASADFVCALAHTRAGRYREALTELRNCAPFLAETQLGDWPATMIERIGLITGGPVT